MSEHVATTEPDARGRFNLRRWTHPRPARWKIFVEAKGKRIILEQMEEL